MRLMFVALALVSPFVGFAATPYEAYHCADRLSAEAAATVLNESVQNEIERLNQRNPRAVFEIKAIRRIQMTTYQSTVFAGGTRFVPATRFVLCAGTLLGPIE